MVRAEGLGDSAMTHKASGRANREGITLIELCEIFPDEDPARR